MRNPGEKKRLKKNKKTMGKEVKGYKGRVCSFGGEINSNEKI